jgi:hypothetical protein
MCQPTGGASFASGTPTITHRTEGHRIIPRLRISMYLQTVAIRNRARRVEKSAFASSVITSIMLRCTL